jgi:hypothetical protein
MTGNKPPNANTYCGNTDFPINVQEEQKSVSSPIGINRFAPNINQLSQSYPMGLPTQKSDTGHMPSIKRNIAISNWIHASFFSMLMLDFSA